jgi:hypothetical protein
MALPSARGQQSARFIALCWPYYFALRGLIQNRPTYVLCGCNVEQKSHIPRRGLHRTWPISDRVLHV